MNPETQTTRSIHYLGSKLRLLESIKNTIDEVKVGDGAICDLFSGSGTVSKYLLQYNDVISVDIQNYSQIICEASMGYLEDCPDINEFIKSIKENEISNELIKCFNDLINYESECLLEAGNGNIEALYEIIEKGSLYILSNEENQSITNGLKNRMQNSLEETRKSNILGDKDSMICRYFGGLYFSYSQAISLDCIAHMVFEYSGLLHTKMLAALLSTTSEIVNTIGKQFAQPLKVRNSNGELKKSLCKKILLDRTMDVYKIFSKWLDYYFSIGEQEHKYQIICDDYISALDKIKDCKISAIYADPPYTRYHYSRYYHVLETICLRDNPRVSTTFPNGKGGISRAIYREDRHQSPFCIKSQAENAFDILFKKIHELQIPLVLSYSPFDSSKAVTPRLQTIDQLVNKAKVYFDDVRVVSLGEFTHSKLNSSEKNFEANHEAELLIVCR